MKSLSSCQLLHPPGNGEFCSPRARFKEDHSSPAVGCDKRPVKFTLGPPAPPTRGRQPILTPSL